MTYPISKKADQLIKNSVLVRDLIRCYDQIEAADDNTITGFDYAERLDQLAALKQKLALIDELLADEVQ